MPVLLIIIGALLIFFSAKSIKKEDYTNFENILKNKEESVKEKDIDIAELKIQFSETILELQKEIYSIKESIEEKSNNNSELLKEDFDNNKEDSINYEIGKASEVIKLEAEGFTDEEICNKLNLGKGEVLLIKGLYKGLKA